MPDWKRRMPEGENAAAVAGLSNQMYRTDSALSLLNSLNGASSGGDAVPSGALTGMESLALQPGGIMSRQLQELKASLPSRQIDPETASVCGNSWNGRPATAEHVRAVRHIPDGVSG